MSLSSIPEILQKRREGAELSSSEVLVFVNGMQNGHVAPEHIAAFCMATMFQPMSVAERGEFTHAVAHSGDVMDWSEAGFDGPVVGKHSSGGVGDKISFLVAPIMASVGAYMPKLSGRGLGHTGGTLDKLESIPGVNPYIGADKLQEITSNIGFAIVGATGEIAPADKTMYRIRDVTSTVMSIDLIAMSIMGKKLAEGTEALVLDVKAGSGAFMKTPEEAEVLAQAMWEIADHNGLKARAVVSDMNQVLGHSAGNALEVAEAIDVLKNPNAANERLKDVAITLSSELMVASQLADDLDQAHKKIHEVLDSGLVAEKFGQLVHALGGPADIIENPEKYLPVAPVHKAITTKGASRVVAMDTEEIGKTIVSTLGGGRQNVDDKINYATGISDVVALGTVLDEGQPIATIHASSEEQAAIAEQRIRAAIILEDPAHEYESVSPIYSIIRGNKAEM